MKKPIYILIYILLLLVLLGCKDSTIEDNINYTVLCLEEKKIITNQLTEANNSFILLLNESEEEKLICKQIELNYLVLNETYKNNLQEYKDQIIIKEKALENCYRYNDEHNITNCLDDLDDCEDDLDDYKDDLDDCEDDLDDCNEDLGNC